MSDLVEEWRWRQAQKEPCTACYHQGRYVPAEFTYRVIGVSGYNPVSRSCQDHAIRDGCPFRVELDHGTASVIATRPAVGR